VRELFSFLDNQSFPLGAVVLALAGVVCIFASFGPFPASDPLALRFFGGLCLVLAGGVGATQLQMRNRDRLRREGAALAVVTGKQIAFVTDEERRIVAASQAATYAFPVPAQATLDVVLAGTLAEPAGVFDSLSGTALPETWAQQREQAMIEAGSYRIHLLRLGRGCLVWTFTPLATEESDAGLPDALPGLLVESSGEVVATNTALKRLLGRAPWHLDDFLDRSGDSNDAIKLVHTSKGTQAFLVSGLGHDENGRRRLVLISPSAVFEERPEAEWDAIEDLPVPLLKVSDCGRIVASNREARNLLHVASTEGRFLSDVLDGPGRPINDWLAQAMGGQGAHVSEFLRGRSENRETFVQVTLSTAGAGDERHLIAVLNDVTELKTLEAQFVQSQKMQAIGQLAGGVAHDFNNLLTAISGHCDLLLLRHDVGHQDYADLIQIHQNANRAASLVGQLLAFSRKQTLQLETIDVAATLADLTHLLNRLVGEKVTLTLEHDADLGPIRADRRQLEQVLMNLVVNARDAMGGAGEIKVVTSNMTLATQMRRDRVVVPPGDYVVVNVVDRGTGIAPDKLPKIFEPFYTTKRTGEGTGLGLSTVYGIVKQTGGYVFVESTVGQGSTFSLVFPRAAMMQAAATLLPPTPEPPKLGAHADGVVLLVEDEAPVRAFASRALRLKGYTVLEAESAEAALSLLEDDDLCVDIFVTDVIMPGMDGPTWVRKAMKARPQTKVVFVSGYPEDAFEDGEAPIPNAVFLPKPFSLAALTQTVQSQLSLTPVHA
jgi:two-component system cell cycle sensor histidine kinase/response regulator CckA